MSRVHRHDHQWSAQVPPSWAGPYPGYPPARYNYNASAGHWQSSRVYGPPARMAAQHASHNWWAQQPTWSAPYAPPRATAVYRNPYKRVPNPGSAEYWSTKLLDNPLGLENMYISPNSTSAVEPSAQSWEPGELESESSAQVHTPWIWTPRELARPEGETTSKSASLDAAKGDTGADGAFASQLQLRPTFSPSIIRTPSHYEIASGVARRRSHHSDLDDTDPDYLPVTVVPPSRPASTDSQKDARSSALSPLALLPSDLAVSDLETVEIPTPVLVGPAPSSDAADLGSREATSSAPLDDSADTVGGERTLVEDVTDAGEGAKSRRLRRIRFSALSILFRSLLCFR